MKLCEKKFAISQHICSTSPSIQRHELRCPNSGAISGFESVIPIDRYLNDVPLSAYVHFVRESILSENYEITYRLHVKDLLCTSYVTNGYY